jgi:hypothetical protein
VDDVEFVDYGGDSLVRRFGEDDGADVVLVGDVMGAEVHVGYVTYHSIPGGDVV